MFFEKKDDFDSFARSLETSEERKMRRFRQAGGASAVLVISGAFLLWISSVINPSSNDTIPSQLEKDSAPVSTIIPAANADPIATPFAPDTTLKNNFKPAPPKTPE